MTASSSSSLYLTERQYWVSRAVAGLTRVKKNYASRHLDPCIHTSYRDIRCDPSRACGKIKYQTVICYQEHISSWVSKADTGSNLFKHTFLVWQQQWGVERVRSGPYLLSCFKMAFLDLLEHFYRNEIDAGKGGKRPSYSHKNLLLSCTASASLDGCGCSNLLKTGMYV